MQLIYGSEGWIYGRSKEELLIINMSQTDKKAFIKHYKSLIAWTRASLIFLSQVDS
jgi:hypothetical protein